MHKHIFCGFLLLVFLLFARISQSAIAFYHYGTEKGLTESIITNIKQDSVGFIWLAGENTLTRFDSHVFKVYRNKGVNGERQPWNKINTIFTDAKGTLWVGSDLGFASYNFLKDEFVTPVQGWDTIAVTDFTEDRFGNLWIGTDQGLVKYNRDTQETTWFTAKDVIETEGNNILPAGYISHICHEPDGKIWISFFQSGICRFDPKNREVEYYEELAGTKISNLKITDLDFRDDKLYYSTLSRGLFCFEPEAEENTSYIDGSYLKSVHNFHLANDSIAWLSTNNGLVQLNYLNKKYERYTSIPIDPLSLDRTAVNYVFVDAEDNLWVSSGVRGISYGLNNLPFNHLMFSDNLPYTLTEKEVTGISFDRLGNLWLGYESGLIEKHSYDPLAKRKYHLTWGNKLFSGSIFSIFQDSKDRIWAGGWESGLNKLNTAGTSFEKVSFPSDSVNRMMRNADIRDIIEGPDGNLWICVHGIGVLKYNPDSHSSKFFLRNDEKPEDGISNDYTYDLCADDDGNIWVSSSNGLSSINTKTEKITSFYHEPKNANSLSDNSVHTVFFDYSGLVWAGTGTGLNVYIPKLKNFIPLKTENDYSFFNVSSIESPGPGEIWVSTKNGLCRVTYTLNENGDNLIYDLTFYYRSNGLISSSYFSRSSGIDENRTLYFGGNEGLDLIVPAEISNIKNLPPKALITETTVYGKKIYPVKNDENPGIPLLELDYDQRMVSFRFTSINFANPEQLRFRYKLEGFDDQWVYPQNEQVATYTNLNSGDYQFVVQTISKDGKWSSRQSSIQLLINQPFWETSTFVTVVVLLFFLLFFIIGWANNQRTKRRQRKLEQIIHDRTNELVERNNELDLANNTKNRFFTIISHDLKSPLSGLLGVLEILSEPDEIPCNKREDLLNAAHHSAKQTFNLLNNLLTWASSQMNKVNFEPVTFNLNELLGKNILLSQEQAKQKNIDVAALFSENLYVFADENMIDTVIRNMLNNAIKFTASGGRIEVKAEAHETSAEVHFADSGVGLSADQFNRIFDVGVASRKGTTGETGTGLGLLISKEFISKNSGKIWATANVPKGTVFHFSIPLANAQKRG